jgi:hypothetical protein
METKLQGSLCRGLRACGLPKEVTHQILNTICRWYDNCGAEWTVGRLKEIRQWYEQYLAGDPQPPAWHRHGQDNLPLGVWKYLFQVGKPAKVLATLSATTVFIHPSVDHGRPVPPLPGQQEKFRRALNGNGAREWDGTVHLIHYNRRFETAVHGLYTHDLFQRKVKEEMDPGTIRLPVLDDMGGSIPYIDENGESKSIHVDLNHKSAKKPGGIFRTRGEELRANALLMSWQSLPIVSGKHLEWLEDQYQARHSWPNNRWSYQTLWTTIGLPDCVGRIACIQEPSLKARWIGNPNRVTQVLMQPLGDTWAAVDRSLRTSGTLDQDAAVRWVQEQLKDGVTIAGLDMTSASDLLNLGSAMDLVSQVFGLFCDEEEPGWWYDHHVRHFVEVSRSPWYVPEHLLGGEKFVTWKQGWCLGTFPSFALLSLTNQAMAAVACQQSGLPHDRFRVIGDDIVMDARAADAYIAMVHDMGGEINLSKTLTSNKVAEFAGRVITPDRVYRKTYNLQTPGDDSFMEYVSSLGPQAAGLLRVRQRKAWETYKYVPGIAVNGPWSQDSFGAPLTDRYLWYLYGSGVAKGEDRGLYAAPKTYESDYLKVMEYAEAIGYDLFRLPLPTAVTEDYLSSQVYDQRKQIPKGDPTKVAHRGGQSSLLERLEAAREDISFEEFSSWTQTHKPGSLLPSEDER